MFGGLVYASEPLQANRGMKIKFVQPLLFEQINYSDFLAYLS